MRRAMIETQISSSINAKPLRRIFQVYRPDGGNPSEKCWKRPPLDSNHNQRVATAVRPRRIEGHARLGRTRPYTLQGVSALRQSGLPPPVSVIPAAQAARHRSTQRAIAP